MKQHIVYQQVVTEEQVIDGKTYDKTIKVVIRNVNASTRQLAVKKFEENTENVKSIRKSKIGCMTLDNVVTLL